MNFLFKFVDGPRQEWEGQGFADNLGDMLEAADDPRYRRVRSNAEADVILLVESVLSKTFTYLKVLLSDADLLRHPQRCFTISSEDDPVPVLPGCYAGISRERFDSTIHRATCYLRPPTNPVKTEAATRRDAVKPIHALSFRGAASHAIRLRLFEKSEEFKRLGPIRSVAVRWDHSHEEMAAYFEEILAAKFVLCPRGYAPSSHRLFEVMQLGRVPIILSDSWVPPTGPDWSRCSLWIPEDSIEDIPGAIEAHLHRAGEMGRAARAEWERWFSPERCMIVAASAIEELLLSRPADYGENLSRTFFKTLAQCVSLNDRASGGVRREAVTPGCRASGPAGE